MHQTNLIIITFLINWLMWTSSPQNMQIKLLDHSLSKQVEITANVNCTNQQPMSGIIRNKNKGTDVIMSKHQIDASS